MRGVVQGVLILAVLLALGCAGARKVPGKTRAAEEWDIREAVFRYQFAHNASGRQQYVDAYFLGIGRKGDQDPPTAFLARFAGHRPAVRPFSRCVSSPDRGVRDSKLGGTGLIFRQTAIHWIGPDKVDVDGGYYEAGLSASGNTYHVVRKGGRWVVTGDKMHWIS